jgi:hypothetical protein
MSSIKFKIHYTRRKIKCNHCHRPLRYADPYWVLMGGKDETNTKSTLCIYCLLKAGIEIVGVDEIAGGHHADS